MPSMPCLNARSSHPMCQRPVPLAGGLQFSVQMLERGLGSLLSVLIWPAESAVRPR